MPSKTGRLDNLLTKAKDLVLTLRSVLDQLNDQNGQYDNDLPVEEEGGTFREVYEKFLNTVALKKTLAKYPTMLFQFTQAFFDFLKQEELVVDGV